MIELNKIKIISGGQSGVDRAALDFSIANNLMCGGYCPKGRLAEDGRIEDKYPLLETITEDYNERTIKNVEISDALLVIHKSPIDKGTMLAIDEARKLQKEIFILKISDFDLEELISWLDKTKPSSLNIAGPRESNDEGIYLLTIKVLQQLLDKTKL